MSLSQLTTVWAALSPVLLAILAGVGWLYRHERERRQAAETKLDEQKKAVYLTLIGVFTDMLHANKTGKPVSDETTAAKMAEVNADILIYGSDQVLFAYQGFLVSARRGKADLRRFGDLIAAIRRDMGHSRTKIGRDEVLRQFINDYDSPDVQRLLNQAHPAP